MRFPVEMSFAESIGLCALLILGSFGPSAAVAETSQVCDVDAALYCGPNGADHSKWDESYHFRYGNIASSFEPHGAYQPSELGDSDCTRYSGCSSPGQGYACWSWWVFINDHHMNFRGWAKSRGTSYRSCAAFLDGGPYDCQCTTSV